MQLSHQNITIDHSFYLNRSLLDGYFLSGYNAQPTATSENPEMGQGLPPLSTVSLIVKSRKSQTGFLLQGWPVVGDRIWKFDGTNQ